MWDYSWRSSSILLQSFAMIGWRMRSPIPSSHTACIVYRGAIMLTAVADISEHRLLLVRMLTIMNYELPYAASIINSWRLETQKKFEFKALRFIWFTHLQSLAGIADSRSSSGALWWKRFPSINSIHWSITECYKAVSYSIHSFVR